MERAGDAVNIITRGVNDVIGRVMGVNEDGWVSIKMEVLEK